AGPRTVRLDFNKVFTDWPDLFGGFPTGSPAYVAPGVILERAAFPNVNGSDHPDLSREMKHSIGFSGGPWVLKHWSKDDAVLVRNPKYWGKQPALDQVVFVPRTDAETEARSIQSG